ncbi:hypothetical protein [Aquiflexum sp.]|uniref:hypothetical protein n=1 Tax=Aquiflexum sp. TaxID=1872584 RepID=UPI003593CD47
MTNNKTLLFVTWDSDQTNYLESLFLPILRGMQEQGGYSCHVMQFSWADGQEVSRIARLAGDMGLPYVQYPIYRKPTAAVGALWTVYQGMYYIRKYLEKYGIGLLMPRSTMPAMMVNRLWPWLVSNNIRVVFDADGLPLQERVDFAGLDTQSAQYQLLKKEETRMLVSAHQVITRSQRSIDFHIENIGESHRPKFSVVGNGRDSRLFRPDEEERKRIRDKWGLGNADMLWVYTGTLGPQYMVEEMLAMFERFRKMQPGTRFLILSQNVDYLKGRIPESLEPYLMIKSGKYSDVPGYLSAADLGMSLRRTAPSLAGLAPIKLGEYLLMGLPVLASEGVGDTEELLKGQDFCFLFDSGRQKEFLSWCEKGTNWNREKIRAFGIEHFSLQKSVEGYLGRMEGRL